MCEIFFCIKQKLSKEELKNYINCQDEEGNSVLLYATFKGNYEVVTELIQNGADIYERNFMGLSVMHMAAQGDRPNLLIFFKDKYDMDILDKDYAGNTPLHWACHTTAENAINIQFIKKLNFLTIPVCINLQNAKLLICMYRTIYTLHFS